MSENIFDEILCNAGYDGNHFCKMSYSAQIFFFCLAASCYKNGRYNYEEITLTHKQAKDKYGFDSRTVTRAVFELEKYGFIQVIKKGSISGGVKTKQVYAITRMISGIFLPHKANANIVQKKCDIPGERTSRLYCALNHLDEAQRLQVKDLNFTMRENEAESIQSLSSGITVVANLLIDELNLKSQSENAKDYWHDN